VRLIEKPGRDGMQNLLAARGIAAGRYFAPIHRQMPWRTDGRVENLKITDAVAQTTLAIPLFNRISEAQQDEVACAIRNIMEC